MLRYDTTALAADDKELIAAADTANDEAGTLEEKYNTMAEGIRDYNRQLSTTKTAFATVAEKVAFVKGAADALAGQTAEFPEPVVEPEPWPEAPIPKMRKR